MVFRYRIKGYMVLWCQSDVDVMDFCWISRWFFCIWQKDIFLLKSILYHFPDQIYGSPSQCPSDNWMKVDWKEHAGSDVWISLKNIGQTHVLEQNIADYLSLQPYEYVCMEIAEDVRQLQLNPASRSETDDVLCRP